jgi:OOP family OmpA-OmpF porin
VLSLLVVGACTSGQTTPTTTDTTQAPSTTTTTAASTPAIDVTGRVVRGILTLSGTVPDEETRKALADAAINAYGQANFKDELTAAGVASSVELTAAVNGLAGFMAGWPDWLDGADLHFNDASLSIHADAVSTEALDAFNAAAEAVAGLTVKSQTQLSPLVGTRAALADLLERSTITFATGSAEITAAGTEVVDRVNEILTPVFAARPAVLVQIGGHTDDQGSDDFNLDLSNRRAQAVLDYLVADGIPAANLSAQGFGESQPVADNSTPEGRAKNRRIEFTLVLG